MPMLPDGTRLPYYNNVGLERAIELARAFQQGRPLPPPSAAPVTNPLVAGLTPANIVPFARTPAGQGLLSAIRQAARPKGQAGMGARPRQAQARPQSTTSQRSNRTS